MKTPFFKSITSPLTGAYLLGVLWFLEVIFVSVLILFRAVKLSGIARMIEMVDVPLLRFLDIHYALFFKLGTGVGLFLIVIFFFITFKVRKKSPFLSLRFNRAGSGYPAFRRRTLELFSATLLFVGLHVFTNFYTVGDQSVGYELRDISGVDWAVVVLIGAVGWFFASVISLLHTSSMNSDFLDSGDVENKNLGEVKVKVKSLRKRIFGLSVIYLLGFTAVIINAIHAHRVFWDPKANGGYDYKPFFGEQNLWQADLVLFSSSALFASIAALAGCVVAVILRRLSGTHRIGGSSNKSFSTWFPGWVGEGSDFFRLSVMAALFWAFLLGVPWEMKLLPEIQAEGAWIMPTVTLVGLMAGLLPLLRTTALALQIDFEVPGVATRGKQPSFRPDYSDYTLWVLLLFPLYPLLRIFRLRAPRFNYFLLTLISAILIGGVIWGITQVEVWFDFDDWRGMMRAGQFPVISVSFALLGAFWVYRLWRLFGKGYLSLVSRYKNKKWVLFGSEFLDFFLYTVIVVVTFVLLVMASWPFWGWKQIESNVLTRACEFNSRHEFELKFLHWLFDFDRDGYSAVLHGADPDDFDPQIGAGRIEPSKITFVPVDEFEIRDSDLANQFPSLIIFFLEGVTPYSISAYERRQLAMATPAIDSIAADGIRFDQARCHYPSTWDAWFSILSGRYVRITESDCAQPFGDRYSRYNNLYKILELIKTNRWSHANTSPYYTLLVEGLLEENDFTTWYPDFDSSISPEDEEQGITQGDYRIDRMVDFLDDLEPGDRFFMCEHMSDTHFPFERTSPERAAELGFSGGLEVYEHDAVLSTGGSNEMLSKYFHNVTRMDSQIGRITKKLMDLGLYDSTMIIVVGDHGFQWWEHEHLYYVTHLYDQSLLIPLIIKIPGMQGGLVSGEPVIQQDILPTIMELAGVDLKKGFGQDPPMPGRSLMPLIREDFLQEDLDEYRNRDMILTTHYDTLGVLSKFRYKMIFDRPFGTFLLFDLEEDPMEMHNLVEENPELLEEMLEKLRVLVKRHKMIINPVQR